ncbi:MAG TPA: resolvase [Ruminococcaceae bacterium]|jgi:DNA invertase Pin-like site-specific DNA recombinase|nr:resolvase [Oscillospiraceae bacterium]
MKKLNEKVTILYARRGENEVQNSIETQKRSLEEYAIGKDIENTLFLSDDGYSGVDFDRRAFQNLMKLVKAGQADTVIVTDLSRLGRNGIEVLRYVDEIFPSFGVRFIALDMLENDEVAS